jgi:hypothetical protein
MSVSNSASEWQRVDQNDDSDSAVSVSAESVAAVNQEAQTQTSPLLDAAIIPPGPAVLTQNPSPLEFLPPPLNPSSNLNLPLSLPLSPSHAVTVSAAAQQTPFLTTTAAIIQPPPPIASSAAAHGNPVFTSIAVPPGFAAPYADSLAVIDPLPQLPWITPAQCQTPIAPQGPGLASDSSHSWEPLSCQPEYLQDVPGHWSPWCRLCQNLSLKVLS